MIYGYIGPIRESVHIRVLASTKTQRKIIIIVIVSNGYRINGRRPNISTSLTDAAVARRLIIPVEMIPQYTLS